ncbi:MAG: hypothetical protein ABEJ69_03875, partial [Candidatus Nanohaloarchaea archaeon]
GEYREMMESKANIEALRQFDDVLEAAADRYAESYEEMEVFFRGPLVHSFPGPAAGVEVSAHSDYRLQGETGWDMDVRVDVIDNPYHVDEIIEPDGAINLSKYADAVREFDPEKTRSRIAKLSLESNGDDFNEEELDRWFSFNQRLREVLEPEEFRNENDVDYLYFFDLKDTQG